MLEEWDAIFPTADDLFASALDGSKERMTSPDARVRVPELVGVPASDAHDLALDAGLLVVAENASHTAAGRARIDRQEPAAGTELEHGAVVRVWVSS